MKHLVLIAACLSFTLGGCASVLAPVSSPSAVADRTVIDEQVGLAVTLAYTAAARSAALAIRVGAVKDAAAIKRIGALDSRAFLAVQGVRSAYLSGNSSNYADALGSANVAVGQLLDAAKGN